MTRWRREWGSLASAFRFEYSAEERNALFFVLYLNCKNLLSPFWNQKHSPIWEGMFYIFNTNLNVLSRCANMYNSHFFHLYLNSCSLQLKAVVMWGENPLPPLLLVAFFLGGGGGVIIVYRLHRDDHPMMRFFAANPWWLTVQDCALTFRWCLLIQLARGSHCGNPRRPVLAALYSGYLYATGMQSHL